MTKTIINSDGRMGLPSASGMERIYLCPGSWQAEQKCPEEEESEYAAIGTQMHLHMENGTIPEDSESAEVIEWCRDMEARLIATRLGEDGVSIAREIRRFDKNHLFSGKPDMVALRGNSALVIDYKFGNIPVASTECNLQMSALAVLIMDNYQIDEALVAILQPYAWRKDPVVVKYTREVAEKARNFFYNCISEARSEAAPLKPSEKACRYCRAKATCPSVSMALESVTSCNLIKSWDSWTADRKLEAYSLSKLAEKWKDSVNRLFERDVTAGLIPGFEMSAGKKSFTVTDAAKAFTVLNGLFPDSIGAAEFTAICKVGITDLDKLVHTVRKKQGIKTTVGESKEWLRKTIEGCAETKTTKGSVKEIGGVV